MLLLRVCVYLSPMILMSRLRRESDTTISLSSSFISLHLPPSISIYQSICVFQYIYDTVLWEFVRIYLQWFWCLDYVERAIRPFRHHHHFSISLSLPLFLSINHFVNFNIYVVLFCESLCVSIFIDFDVSTTSRERYDHFILIISFPISVYIRRWYCVVLCIYILARRVTRERERWYVDRKYFLITLCVKCCVCVCSIRVRDRLSVFSFLYLSACIYISIYWAFQSVRYIYVYKILPD